MVLEDILYDWSGLPREARKKMMTQTKKDSGFVLSVSQANLTIKYQHNADYDRSVSDDDKEECEYHIPCDCLYAVDEVTGESIEIAVDEANDRLIVYHIYREIASAYIREGNDHFSNRHHDRALLQNVIAGYEKLFKTMKVAMMVKDHIGEQDTGVGVAEDPKRWMN